MPTPFNDLTYHNGTVLLGTLNGNQKTYNIYNIYIGNFSASTIALVDYFANNIGNSNWFKILTTYYQVVNNQKVYIDTKKTTLVRNLTVAYKGALSDGAINQIVFNANQIFPCPTCIFMVMFKGDYQYDGWNSDWCGYHTLVGLGSQQANVGVLGDPTSASPITVSCLPDGNKGYTANLDFAGDNMVSTYGQQLANIITNPDPGSSSYGWARDSDDTEVGSACSFHFYAGNSNIQVDTKNFLVQGLWQNGFGCITEYTGLSPSRKIFPSHAPVAQPTASPALSGLGGFDLTYHGPGGVLANGKGDGVVLYNVFLGDLSPSTTSLMTFFSQQIGSSSWYNVLSSYYLLDDTYGILYVANTASFGGNYNDLTSSRGLQLNQSYIENLLLNIVSANPNTTTLDVYTIMFRGDFNVSINGQLWLKDWCSYHGSFLAQPGDQVVKYALVGDPSTAPGQTGSVCEPVSGRPTANGDLGADSMAVGYAQQLAQTVTDYQQFAWFSDSNGLEVGSACYGRFGPNFNSQTDNSNIVVGGRNYLVQELWQRGVGCTLQLQR
eukprot:gene20913-21652_t